jgi:2-polyprenyl-3-methyl-5-hydroxy-6-metoxy-1,4-benzoquinol methylase
MKEREIRPDGMKRKYIELTAQDAKFYFSEFKSRNLSCVACNSSNTDEEFVKEDFSYSLCRDCGTLYQTPRPSLEEYEAFYSNSKSSRYWSEVFYPAVAEVRREKIIKPRVESLLSICKNSNIQVDRLIDIGAGYGIFLDEWRNIMPKTELIAIEPSVHLAKECNNKNLNTINSIVENVRGYENYADLVVCFEVLEHVDSPLEFLKTMKRMVRPGGYLFISTLCIDGFDLQTLWEKSSQISPPHHINFLSIKGFEKLFERLGLDEVNITTPGMLDVDIVKNFMKSHEAEVLKNDRFLSFILEDQNISDLFQTFLQENKLSSHAWVIGKKPDKKDD